MIVGLTGGIGSGKSEVSARFERLGITAVDADVIARQVVEPGSSALDQIAKHFGAIIIAKDGLLDRKQLRKIIFEQPAEKNWLENLLHPIIRAETIAQLNRSQSPYTILSSPLLLETNQFELVDRILVVDADEKLQLSRASSRDSISPENIQKIMQNQLSRSTRLARADDIIHNQGDFHELQDQVESLHARYLLLAQHPN